MMQKIVLLLSLSFLFIRINAAEIPTFVKETNPKAGKPFTVTFQVNATAKYQFPTIRIGEIEPNFNIVKITQDTIQDKINLNLHLIIFEKGEYNLPAFPFIQGIDTLYTQSQIFNAERLSKSILNKPLYDIKPIKEVDFTWKDYFYRYKWIFIGFLSTLLGAIILLLLYLILKKIKKSHQNKVPILPPFEEAITALDKLKEKESWKIEDKQYYSDLTAILRRYFERKLKFNALESTSDEILIEIKPYLNKEEYQHLAKLLQDADLAKFAKFQVTEEHKLTYLEPSEFLIRGLEERYVDKTIIEEAKDIIKVRKKYFELLNKSISKTPKGTYALWWISEIEPNLNESETLKALDTLFYDYLMFAPLILAKIFLEKGITVKDEALQLSHKTILWTFETTDCGIVVLQYSKKLGIRFLFNSKKCDAQKKIAFLQKMNNHIYNFIQAEISPVQQRNYKKMNLAQTAISEYNFAKNIIIQSENKGTTISQMGAIDLS